MDKPNKKEVPQLRTITVSFKPDKEQRETISRIFAGNDLTFLTDYADKEQRSDQLDNTELLIAWNPNNELDDLDRRHLENIKFVQLISAGYDHLRFEMFNPACQIAANQGAYALPMAEHVLAMLLERGKKLRYYHDLLAAGKFEQWRNVTKQITGSTLGIVGFGSIGKETARLMRPFELKILALNTTGNTDQRVDFCGTLKDLDYVLANSDFILLSLPLDRGTEGLIGRRELEIMKPVGILVNVARGAIVQQKALYEHLKSHPDFSACIDAWWVEPFRQGEFRVDYPFFELPNLLGSPHNSALVDGIMLQGVARAAENAAGFLRNGNANGLVHRPNNSAR